MFSSIGWGEIALLVVVALFIFGPDRLPGAAKQASTALRSIRETLTGARRQLKDEFGDQLPDFDPRMLNPKEFVKKHLLEDLDDEPVKPAANANAMEAHTPAAAADTSTPTDLVPAADEVVAAPKPPPYDAEAT